jgi:acetyl-CoA carboxylase, biotin carboxylase subunit
MACILPVNLQVPPNYDSLLGKLIVWAEDRNQAIARMKRALSETVISGVPTTIDYHQLILDTKDFRDGNVDTGALPACCLQPLRWV